MERHTLIAASYFKAKIEFIQEQELLIGAGNIDEAREMLLDSILPDTRGFQINDIAPLTPDELILIQDAFGPKEVDPSGEVIDLPKEKLN